MKRGFTLLEIMLAVAVLAILVTMADYYYSRSIQQDNTVLLLDQCANGVALYYLNNKTMPDITNFVNRNTPDSYAYIPKHPNTVITASLQDAGGYYVLQLSANGLQKTYKIPK